MMGALAYGRMDLWRQFRARGAIHRKAGTWTDEETIPDVGDVLVVDSDSYH